MPTTITIVVKNEVVVTKAPPPGGTQVDIRLSEELATVPAEVNDELPAEGKPVLPGRLTPAKLRRMPREQWQVSLAAATEMAKHDHHSDKEMTGFEVFSEEELNDDESDSR
jgi:uncharacterized protein YeaO (DUF488 family)